MIRRHFNIVQNESTLASGAPRLWRRRGTSTSGLEMKPVKPQPPTNFYGFHIKKKLILAHFFIENEYALSAVTMDNEKIFSQLTGMSKNRSLAKVSKKKLQSLLV